MANDIFDKPFSLVGDATAEKMYQIDAMFEDLYRRLASTQQTVVQAFPEGQPVDVTRWKTGPWTYDGIVPSQRVARLVHNLAAATEYTDYAPEGIDTAVELNVTPLGAGTSISGVRHFGQISRKVCIANASATETLTIPHEGTNSTDIYRFNLPDSTDIELAPYQVLWASYNPELHRWQMMVTPMQSGGLSAGASTGPILTSVLDITEAVLEGMHTGVRPTHIAAGTATQIHVPLHWIVQGNVTTAYSSNPSLRIRWGTAGGTPDIFTPASIGFTSVGRKAMFADASAFVNNIIGDYKGAPVAIDLSAIAGTPVTGVATLRSILYYVTLEAAY